MREPGALLVLVGIEPSAREIARQAVDHPALAGVGDERQSLPRPFGKAPFEVMGGKPLLIQPVGHKRAALSDLAHDDQGSRRIQLTGSSRYLTDRDVPRSGDVSGLPLKWLAHVQKYGFTD